MNSGKFGKYHILSTGITADRTSALSYGHQSPDSVQITIDCYSLLSFTEALRM